MGAGRDSDSFVSPVIKYLVFTFNFLFWLIGIALIAIGSWAYYEKYKFETMRDLDVYDLVFDLSIIMIVVGAIVFLVAFAGFVGALRENICLLKAFSYFLGILFVSELILAILAFVFSNQIKTAITDVAVTEGLERYRDDPDLQNFVDWIQGTFMCCGIGINGYQDWSNNEYFNCTDDNPSAERCGVPYSCCLRPEAIDGKMMVSVVCGYGTQSLNEAEAQNYIYTEGCVDKLISIAEDNMYIIGGIALGLAVPQVLGIALGCILIKDIDTERVWIGRN